MKNYRLLMFALAAAVATCIYQGVKLAIVTQKINVVNSSVTVVPFASLKKKILMSGDKGSYERLKLEYMDMDCIESLLPWALIMAHKFNYRQAYFDVYASLQGINMYYGGKGVLPNSLEITDTVSRKMAVSYLIKASDLGDEQAKIILDEYRSKGG